MYLRGMKLFRGRNVQDIAMIGSFQVDESGTTLREFVEKYEKKRKWIPGYTVIDFESDYERGRFSKGAK